MLGLFWEKSDGSVFLYRPRPTDSVSVVCKKELGSIFPCTDRASEVNKKLLISCSGIDFHRILSISIATMQPTRVTDCNCPKKYQKKILYEKLQLGVMGLMIQHWSFQHEVRFFKVFLQWWFDNLNIDYSLPTCLLILFGMKHFLRQLQRLINSCLQSGRRPNITTGLKSKGIKLTPNKTAFVLSSGSSFCRNADTNMATCGRKCNLRLICMAVNWQFSSQIKF